MPLAVQILKGTESCSSGTESFSLSAQTAGSLDRFFQYFLMASTPTVVYNGGAVKDKSLLFIGDMICDEAFYGLTRADLNSASPLITFPFGKSAS